jgi:hypothetical protein
VESGEKEGQKSRIRSRLLLLLAAAAAAATTLPLLGSICICSMPAGRQWNDRLQLYEGTVLNVAQGNREV